MLGDLREELRARPKLPAGETGFSLRRTRRLQRQPLSTLLGLYERFGPVFTVRMFHRPIVVMLGPEANQFITGPGAENFSWRWGMFGEHLTPLLGEGLITTDGEQHDRARRIMMPAFHRARLDALLQLMQSEISRSLETWRAGETLEVYGWARTLAVNVAMRALLGVDPHEQERGRRTAELFHSALSFYDVDVWRMALRGPRSPWSRMQAARRDLDELTLLEIARRRGRSSDASDDLLGMLLAARAEDGVGFGDLELRDQITTLLFGGHHTIASTLAFLFYELGRHPDALQRVVAEQDDVLAGRPPTVDELLYELPQLRMAVDETLRLYPPVWFGPRRAVANVEFAGHLIPKGTHVFYSAWATQRLPELYAKPDEYIPQRFADFALGDLPRGAYMPFGGGRRICIGKRFGELAVKATATQALQRFRLALTDDFGLRIATTPALSPRDGLPMLVHADGQQ